jgi:hypothetical protein
MINKWLDAKSKAKNMAERLTELDATGKPEEAAAKRHIELSAFRRVYCR